MKNTPTTLNLSTDFYEVPSNKSKILSGRQYISWGDDNNYPEYLKSLRLQPEHGAILKSKIEWIALGGMNKELLTPEQLSIFSEWDIDTFIYNITKDLETYGGISFYVIKSRDGKSIAKLEYVPYDTIRYQNPKEGDNFLVGDDWSKYRPDVEIVPAWSPDTEEVKSLYYYKGTSDDYYGEPPYFEGIHAIETLLRLDKFHLNLVKKGFFIPTIVTFRNGQPSEEAKWAIQKDFEAAFTSEETAGGFILLFNDPETEPISIETLETSDLDEKFKSVMEAKEQDIFTAHKVTSPTLFGITTPGALGQRNEMIDAWELFKSIYIKPHQEVILGCLTHVLSQNWPDIELELAIIPPIEPEITDDILTLAEKRVKYGIGEDELTPKEEFILTISDMSIELQKRVLEGISNEQLYRILDMEKLINTEEN